MVNMVFISLLGVNFDDVVFVFMFIGFSFVMGCNIYIIFIVFFNGWMGFGGVVFYFELYNDFIGIID